MAIAGEVIIAGPNAAGAASTEDPLQIAGVDSSGDVRPVSTDTSGNVNVNVISGGGSNPSVSATGASVPADATFVGAENPSGDLTAVHVDASGYLEVNVKAGSSGNSAASATGSAVPADADYIGFNVSGDLTGVSASAPLPVTDSIGEGYLATLAGVIAATGASVPSDAIFVGAENPSGDLTALNVDAAGYLEVNVKAGSSGNSAASATGSAVPVDADYIGFGSSGDLTGVSASTPLPVTDVTAEGYLDTLAGTVSSSKVNVEVQNTTLTVVGDGTAGSPAGGVVSVQGVSGGETLPVTATIAAAQTIAVTNAGTFAVQDSTSEGYLATLAGTVGSSKVNVNVENTTLEVVGAAASGSAVSGNPVLVGGSDGTDARTLLTDNTGQLKVLVEDTVTVDIAASQTIAVTNAGTFAVQDSTSEGYLATLAGTVGSSKVNVNVENTSLVVVGDGTAGTPAGGVVSVQGVSGGTAVPVSGTFYPATQPISGTVTAEIEGHAGATLDGAAGSPSTQCVTIQGNSSGTAVPVSAASLPLPTGAATSALQSSTQGSVAPGTAASDSNLCGGVFNTTAPAPTNGQQTALQQDAAASLAVNTEGKKATYCVVVGAQSIISGVNLVIQGSSTKTVRITHILFSGTATTATGEYVVMGISSAPSGGTSATSNLIQGAMDSNNGSATAVAAYYTVAPTPGTIKVDFAIFSYPFGLLASPNEILNFDYGQRPAQCPTLRGTSQYFFLNIGGAPTGGTYSITVEWSEE